MKKSDVLIVLGAALAVVAILKYRGATAAPQYWTTAQGNTGYPDAARTGTPITGIGGKVWI